ncbi:hypothetical protein Godav_011484 [Gossypium davidsonii]|uniref:RNase H type-1 domain-containing protein n=1 Tax=Gossypium davidsonii TaxID=34287 RepID=A0A7J8RAV3_GOSDV|nr:hypothetical protein [Gossypium davidsonii]
MGHELLPTNAKISSIRQSFISDCPRCGASVETLIHPFKDCSTARATLTTGGLNVIIRDFDGFVHSGGWGFKDEDTTVDWEKLYALEESLKITRSLNIPNAIFETDCTSLANKVKKGREDITIIRYQIKEILKTMEMCNNAAVNWINRSCNKVADFICKYAIINDCTLVFGMDYPKEIHDLVIDDFIN